MTSTLWVLTFFTFYVLLKCELTKENMKTEIMIKKKENWDIKKKKEKLQNSKITLVIKITSMLWTIILLRVFFIISFIFSVFFFLHSFVAAAAAVHFPRCRFISVLFFSVCSNIQVSMNHALVTCFLRYVKCKCDWETKKERKWMNMLTNNAKSLNSSFLFNQSNHKFQAFRFIFLLKWRNWICQRQRTSKCIILNKGNQWRLFFLFLFSIWTRKKEI